MSHREEGSVLALVPAGFLVLILLAALAVDSAVAYLGQEQLHDALTAAANDAVTAALDNGSFYGSGVIGLDQTAAGRAVCLSVLAQNASGLHALQVWMAVDGDSVHLKGQAQVDNVFGRVIPGFGHHTVRASVSAVATQRPLASATSTGAAGVGASGGTGPSGGAPASGSARVGVFTPLHCR
jgi:hypothetical protein